MILPIAQLPAQVLRLPVIDIVFPLNKAVRRLCQDMIDTIIHADGIGLAAPQVGKRLNLALIFLQNERNKPFFIFNPRVLKVSKKLKTIEEGCLSLPGVFGNVQRPRQITIEFTDASGQRQELTDDGWIARVCQHEIDHLCGILIADKFEKVTQGQELLEKIYTAKK